MLLIEGVDRLDALLVDPAAVKEGSGGYERILRQYRSKLPEPGNCRPFFSTALALGTVDFFGESG